MSHGISDDAVEFAVCGSCLQVLAYDDRSGLDDDEERAVLSGLLDLHTTYEQVIPDGTELGFSHLRCDCCGALPGDRFRVLCFGEKCDG